MLKLSFSILLSFFILGNVFSQKLKYDIVKGGKTIGNVLAKKIMRGDTAIITITSEAKFKLLFSFNVSYLLEEKFVNGVLISGRAINYLNGNIQKESEFEKVDGKYIVKLDGETTDFALNKITYSITNLYFDQPPNLDLTIFSQQFAAFLPLFKKGDNEFELESKNGDNIYYYKDNVLEKMKVSRTYATFYFIRKE